MRRTMATLDAEKAIHLALKAQRLERRLVADAEARAERAKKDEIVLATAGGPASSPRGKGPVSKAMAGVLSALSQVRLALESVGLSRSGGKSPLVLDAERRAAAKAEQMNP